MHQRPHSRLRRPPGPGEPGEPRHPGRQKWALAYNGVWIDPARPAHHAAIPDRAQRAGDGGWAGTTPPWSCCGPCSCRGGPTASCYALVRLTRTLLDDDHPSAGGAPPDIRHDTSRVVFDYEYRAAAERPIIRTYTAKIAVPSDRPCSWELPSAMTTDFWS